MDAPFSSFYDLSDLSAAGAEIILVPTPDQREKLAQWADLDAVEAFTAHILLHRHSGTRLAYEAKLAADIVQSCVVTLEPVRVHLELDIERALHLTKLPSSVPISAHELSTGQDDGPEEIQDPHYDIAGPVLEEFTLAIDRYPRAPGVVFEAPADPEPRDSPFAALNSLKKGE